MPGRAAGTRPAPRRTTDPGPEKLRAQPPLHYNKQAPKSESASSECLSHHEDAHEFVLGEQEGDGSLGDGRLQVRRLLLNLALAPLLLLLRGAGARRARRGRVCREPAECG